MKKTIIFILVFSSIFLQGCEGKTEKAERTDRKEQNYGLTQQSQRKMVKIDEKEINKTLKNLEKTAKDCQNYEDYLKWEEPLATIDKKMTNNMVLLSIKMYTNLEDQEAAEKMNEIQQLAHTIEQREQKLYRIHAQKDYWQQIEKELASKNKLMLREIQQINTKEKEDTYLQLRNQLVDCLSDYQQKDQMKETTYKGKKYIISELGSEKEKEKIERQYYQELLDLCKEQITIEKELATMLQYPSVAEMYHESYNRPYTQGEVEQYFEQVKEHYTPLLEKYSKVDGQTVKLKHSIKNVATKEIGSIFKKSNQELFNVWNLMLKNKLYDITPSKKKLPNYAMVTGKNPPFLLGNLENNEDSLQTFIHEYGHFFVSAMQHNKEIPNSNDIEEIYSQGLELLMSYKLKEIAPQAQTTFINRLVTNQFLSMTYMQEFQTRMYDEPELTLEKMKTLDEQLRKEYFDDDAAVNDYSWVENLTADRPLGMLEYFLGAIVAVQLHETAENNYEKAFNQYMNMIKNPDQTDLSKIVTEAGLKDPKSIETIRQTAEYLTGRVE